MELMRHQDGVCRPIKPVVDGENLFRHGRVSCHICEKKITESTAQLFFHHLKTYTGDHVLPLCTLFFF
jgi:hypothetical protein